MHPDHISGYMKNKINNLYDDLTLIKALILTGILSIYFRQSFSEKWPIAVQPFITIISNSFSFSWVVGYEFDFRLR
jgi:hypothetical protein